MSNNNNCSFPSSKDLKYLLLICVIVNIGIIVNYCYYNEGFVSKVEFASTITSIILSVLAIVLTMTESSKTTRANEQILESSDTIKLSTKEVKSSSEELEGITKNLSSLNIEKELTSLKQLLTSVDERVCTVSTDFDSIKGFFSDNSDIKTTPISVGTSIPLNDILKQLINNDNCNRNLKVILYFMYKASKMDNPKNSFQLYYYNFIKAMPISSVGENPTPNQKTSFEFADIGFYTGIKMFLQETGTISTEGNKLILNANLDDVMNEYEKNNANIVNIVNKILSE